MRRHAQASRTGAATASSGGVAVSGVLHGDIHLHTQALSRSLYRDQIVAKIAPKQLQDRELELDEIARFCTIPSDDLYMWWQAPAWSGKSALLSWFVLNPPPGIRIVSFFITARFRGHADRSAFLEFVLEQLSEILGEPMPAITEASGEVEFLDRLTRTARLLAELGERLVLVVDGLDEDRGVTAGPDAYSIAALLPEETPDGVWVIVAGRPNPPVPDDVPAKHPLRKPSVVRIVTTSPHATAVQSDMRKEIKQLLFGSAMERELLGLVTAAGGGLSGHDLAELTKEPAFVIDEHLRTVAGRSFVRRAVGSQTTSHPDVYLLGHEEIQVEVVSRLGETELRRYRKQVHDWAAGYRLRGWPPETPDYLLRGYGRLLREVGDLPGMLVLATDRGRHDRLFSVTGGDSAALAEVAAVQEMLHAEAPDDLAALGRVVVHRLRITNRAGSIKVNLPHVWVRLGQPERAEMLARSMPDLDRRAWALAGVAQALAAEGEVEEALRIMDTVLEPRWHTYGVAGIAKALVLSGENDRARQLAGKAEETSEGVEALARLIEIFALLGDKERTDSIALACRDQDDEKWFLAGPLASAGDLAWAQDIATSVREPRWRTYALVGIAQALAAAGDPSQAREFAATATTEAFSIDDATDRGLSLAPLIRVYADIGEMDQAEHLIGLIVEAITAADPEYHEAYAWAELAKAVAAIGDPHRAGEYAERAERASIDETSMGRDLASLVLPLLEIGEPETALKAARQIIDPHVRAWALMAVAAVSPEAVVAEAKKAAAAIPWPEFRVDALGAIANTAFDLGDTTTAHQIRDELVEAASVIDDNECSVSALIQAADISKRLGESVQARALAHKSETKASELASPSRRAYASAPAIASLGAQGEHDLAWGMAQRLLSFATSSHDGFELDATRVLVVDALAATDQEHALEVAHSIKNPLTGVTDSITHLAISDRNFDRAEELARAADRDAPSVDLAELAAAAAVNGDKQRTLRLCREAVQALDPEPGPWHHITLVILVTAMVRLEEHPMAVELAAKIFNQHTRVWSVAELTRDLAQRRSAVAAALRVTDWSPIWAPILSPRGTKLPELRNDLLPWPARTLATSAPEAVKAIAEEMLLLTGRPV